MRISENVEGGKQGQEDPGEKWKGWGTKEHGEGHQRQVHSAVGSFRQRELQHALIPACMCLSGQAPIEDSGTKTLRRPSGLFIVCVHWTCNAVCLIYGVHPSPLLLPTDSCPWFREDNSSFDRELLAEALTSAPEVPAYEKSDAAFWHEHPPSKEGTGGQLGLRKLHKKGQVWVWVSDLNSMVYSQHLVSMFTKSHLPCALAF